MRVIVTSNYSETGEVAGGMIAKVVQDKPTATLGLATGSSPEVVYANLIRAYEAGEVDFSKVHTVNLDEYLGLAPDHPQSYRYFMNTKLFDHINVPKENTFVASGVGDEVECVKEFRLHPEPDPCGHSAPGHRRGRPHCLQRAWPGAPQQRPH